MTAKLQPAPPLFDKVGILGGMGVEATLELLKRVHAATEANDDQDHVPMLIDMNPQVPSRIRYLIEKDGPDPEPVLVAMARGLEAAGARALAMPCNTAHLFVAAIEKAVNIPFLNMPKIACARAAADIGEGAKAGILASPATYSTGLFSDLLDDVGLGAIWPDDEDGLLHSIRRIKKAGPGSEDVALLEREAVRLADRGAACVIVGCSEFSLISTQFHSPIPVLDTLDVLVDEIMSFSGATAKSAAQ